MNQECSNRRLDANPSRAFPLHEFSVITERSKQAAFTTPETSSFNTRVSYNYQHLHPLQTSPASNPHRVPYRREHETLHIPCPLPAWAPVVAICPRPATSFSPNDLAERIVVSWFKNPTTVQKQSKENPRARCAPPPTIISHMSTGRKNSVKSKTMTAFRISFSPNSVANKKKQKRKRKDAPLQQGPRHRLSTHA